MTYFSHPLAAWINKNRSLFRNQTVFAEAMGVTRSRLSQILAGDSISAEMAIKIHRLTNGEVPATLFCPHIWRRPEDVPTESPSMEGTAP